MSNYFLDREALRARLELLPRRRLIVYLADLCVRLLPTYESFSDASKWGDPGTLRAAVQMMCDMAEGREVPERNIRELIEALGRAAPDTEWAWADDRALYACQAIASALLACLNDGLEFALDAAHSAFVVYCDFDAVEMNSGDSREGLAVQPSVREEVRRQQETINTLACGGVDLFGELLRRVRGAAT